MSIRYWISYHRGEEKLHRLVQKYSFRLNNSRIVLSSSDLKEDKTILFAIVEVIIGKVNHLGKPVS